MDDQVVDEVTPDLAEDDADGGGEVDEGGRGVGEEVGWWLHELGDGRGDADGEHVDPREETDGRYEEVGFRQDLGGVFEDCEDGWAADRSDSDETAEELYAIHDA